MMACNAPTAWLLLLGRLGARLLLVLLSMRMEGHGCDILF